MGGWREGESKTTFKQRLSHSLKHTHTHRCISTIEFGDLVQGQGMANGMASPLMSLITDDVGQIQRGPAKVH